MEEEKSSSYSHAAASVPNQSVTTTTKLKFIVLGGANAGKTSILRKYFHGKFDSARRPTVGSDFYTQKKTMKSTTTTTNNSTSLSMQVWDTPGRERFAANHPQKPLYTAAFSDSFFKNADAAILVYDITSSTSFTHVLKWYEDLMARIRRLEVSGQRIQTFPVVIVGTKVDIMKERESHPSQQRVGVVPQRNVLGMTSNFRGKDLHYEYTVSAPVDSGGGGGGSSQPQPLQESFSSSSSRMGSKGALSTTTSASQPSQQNKNSNNNTTPQDHHRHRFELSTYMGTDEKTNYLQAVLNNEVQIGSYLESLLSTEDGSHPDKDMVLLWCMRNGLKHMEVSALDGTGIDEMIQTVIDMSLAARESSSALTSTSTTSTAVEQQQQQQQQQLVLLERNKELDLHQRYATKDPNCFRCFSLFRICGKPS